MHFNPSKYTSRSHGYGIYSELIFVDSKALKSAHSKLSNYFNNESIGKKQLIEIPIRNRVKYNATSLFFFNLS